MTTLDISAVITAVTDKLHPVWRGFADMTQEARVSAVDVSANMYEADLRTQVEKSAPAAGTAILSAFSGMKKACTDDDSEVFRLQRQTLLKNFLHACYTGTVTSLNASDAAGASTWLAYIASMAKWEDDHEVMVAMMAAESGSVALDAAASLVRDRLLAWFAEQIGIEAEEAIGAMERGRLFQAHLEAVEAIEFWRAIDGDLVTTLGSEKASQIKNLVASFYDVTKAKDEAKIIAVSTELKDVMEQATASVSK
jgi:hypothetical protein